MARNSPKAVYALVDPRDGKVKYVGASSDVTKRYRQHLTPSASQPFVQAWIRGLRKIGAVPDLRVLVPESEDWRVQERRQIAKHKDTILNPRVEQGGTLDVRPAVAQALAAMRESRGMSRSQVASAVNRDPATVYRWENGTRTPDLNDLAALASTYDVEPSEFMPTKQQINDALDVIRGREEGAE